MRPRATAGLAIAPATVSDLTAPAVIGIEAWQFRTLLQRERVPHARLGKRVVARVDHVLAAIDRLALEAVKTEAPSVDRVDAEPTTDAILARIGRVRT
jgi:hypothetical protein